MKVFVNNQERALFQGAKAIEAVHNYSEKEYRQVVDKKKKIYDGHGNEVCPDGELSEGTRLFIR